MKDTIKQIYNYVLRRYEKERPDIKLTQAKKDAIWFALLGEFQRNGKEAAWKYAKTAILS